MYNTALDSMIEEFKKANPGEYVEEDAIEYTMIRMKNGLPIELETIVKGYTVAYGEDGTIIEVSEENAIKFVFNRLKEE